MGGVDRPPKPCVLTIFAPSPILTVTVEPGPRGEEVHFHAGGQGVWVARMAAGLGARVTLCTSLGGDRRDGERRVIVETPSPVIGRHELDDLFGLTVTAGLAADATMLTGERQDDVLPAETYCRIAEDLRGNGCTVMADLAREPLRAALRGTLDVVKISDEELCKDGWANGGSTEEAPDRCGRRRRRRRLPRHRSHLAVARRSPDRGGGAAAARGRGRGCRQHDAPRAR